ncbi:hypothetical protein E3Q23_02555 [Wallemia mellicola]|uniref:Adenosine kinase n=1 Tax=Wallemia mellicola TaxID=1708541 RepID=A0A4T0PJS2_9BASI|nr:hypothetical protein E3Q23_02555 [Wallemia mellicola]TIC10664.1 adenosine kinase [Wallemia mellicola]TIC64416.1 adenosine kinase [Wallemia mellicola]
MPAKLFAIGNPLLDISVTEGAQQLLEQYKLKANDAILAGEEHQPIYEQVRTTLSPLYLAGGAGQNTARAASYVLPEGSVVYTGAVGNDNFAKTLREANEKEGVESAYQVVEGTSTGACCVLITGHDRSLCTNLAAAEKFTVDHLRSAEIKQKIEEASHFYIGGFFLTHGLESALEVAKHSASADKTLAFNLSAPFIPQFFKDQVDQLIPYADIVFGNESEAEAYAKSHGIADTSAKNIAQHIASLPKTNSGKDRIVVITQGAQETVVAIGTKSVTSYPVTPLAKDAIVDTNGAGDATAGGFVAAFVLGSPIPECVEVGHKLGAMCIQQNGPQLPYPKQKVL